MLTLNLFLLIFGKFKGLLMSGFSGHLNCGSNNCECCKIYTVVYYQNCSKVSEQHRFFRTVGDTVARKIAASKPSCFMAVVL